MEIEKLINKRRSVAKRVETLLKLAQGAQNEASKRENFGLRFENLNELVNLFDSLQLEIVSLVETSELDDQDEVQIAFDNVQYAIKRIHRELFDIESGDGNSVRTLPQVSDVRSGNSRFQGHVKLPRIELPKFDGTIKNWTTFYDVFRTVIHENASLSDIERFQYLISCLSSEALTLVKNLPLTANNYQIAFKTLVSRYHNERVLITNYWQNIFHAPKANADSAPSLRGLLSVFTENLAALGQFEGDLWDFTKLNFLLQKIDSSTKQRFEIQFSDCEVPTYHDLCQFLERQCRALEATVMTSSYVSSTQPASNFKKGSLPVHKAKATSSFVTAAGNALVCVYCKQNHSLLKCNGFLELSPGDRHAVVKRENLCFNCLSGSHSGKSCNSKFSCRVCHKRHHTLIHFPKQLSSVSSDQTDENCVKPAEDNQLKVMTSVLSGPKIVLFSTAMVSVRDVNGNYQTCRALLDPASEANFLTERCAKKLGFSMFPSSIPIRGLNQMATLSNLGTVMCKLKPLQHLHPSFEVEVIVIPTICGQIPANRVYIQSWKHIQGLSLADPSFGDPSDIDMLLGAELYAHVVTQGLRKGKRGEPNAINTVFGWVLIGKVDCAAKQVVNAFCTSLDVSLENTIKRFWELEEIPQDTTQSPDDIICENIFVNTHSRDQSGRYVVQLPFQNLPPQLGESYSSALRRFLSLEVRLLKNPSLYESYSACMKDYIEQDHMAIATENRANNEVYYIPHHCVLKPESTSTKLRVVFDASAKTSNGASLNDVLYVGPKLQRDIVSLLLAFRIHSIVFTADIRQMYRQILIADYQRDYQRILWRFSKSEPVQAYRLNTVTFGVSSSPYLAIRCLLQLAQDEGHNYPLAAEVLNSYIYVDDVVSGADSPTQACEVQSQLVTIFAKAGFELRKWASNHPALLTSIPVEHQQPHVFEPSDGTSLKILGLQWCPSTDSFSYKVEAIDRPCSKRNVLSELARIYDPLGLLAPITLFAKHLMQCLWSSGINWDDEPPPAILERWSTYKSQLSCLSSIKMARRVVMDDVTFSELHGFCDASQNGYSAVVYLRQISCIGSIKVFFVCAKSKVAPLKSVSIPRLELCAAVLLSDLIEFVLNTYKNYICLDKVYAWSDSTVVLAWIKSSPHRWKTFVANRVSHIQDKVSPMCWNHVNGVDNPADCASRGLMPTDLLSHSLWWAGPKWLASALENWPKFSFGCAESSPDLESEERKVVLITAVVPSKWIDVLLNKFSSWRKIQGIVAFCQRFIQNLRASQANRKRGALSNEELSHASLLIVRSVQREAFNKEILNLESNEDCSKPFRKLAPFLDEDGVVRVGGRLRHSKLEFDAKHPMLLPRSHRLTELIIEHVHRIHLHPGPRTLHYLLSQQFWILSARRAINHAVAKCNRCFRVRPAPIIPFMGDLPPTRVSQVKAFSHSGVDFAGPFFITLGKRRGVQSMKAYVCVFVCFAIKAIHLELVSNLSSEAFLAALRRFVARRGRCSDLYSDSGTNFVGANKLMLSYCRDSAGTLAINWHFNPPAAPHFGGLWEAGVKSVKSHLKRVVGLQILTYEEFNTVLTQVEAVLNSRPLCDISGDPNDFTALTPAHFLTMEPLYAPPDQNVTDLKLNRLNRWQLVQRIHQDFWRRWHVEYLHTLQQRNKWNSHQQPPLEGSLVVIREENLSPLRWSLGRLIKLYPGRDGVPRVAQVRTDRGVYDRVLAKLCPLPSQ